MPKIDLFNKAADEAKITEAIDNGTFYFRSKLYAKYLLKNAAQGAVVGAVLGLAITGALATIAVALEAASENEEVTE